MIMLSTPVERDHAAVGTVRVLAVIRSTSASTDEQPGSRSGIDGGGAQFSPHARGPARVHGTHDECVRFPPHCDCVANMFREKSALHPHRTTCRGSPVVFARGPVPEVSTRVLRRGGGAGACHRTAQHGPLDTGRINHA